MDIDSFAREGIMSELGIFDSRIYVMIQNKIKYERAMNKYFYDV